MSGLTTVQPAITRVGEVSLCCQPDFFNNTSVGVETRRSMSFASRIPAIARGLLAKTTYEPFGRPKALTFCDDF